MLTRQAGDFVPYSGAHAYACEVDFHSQSGEGAIHFKGVHDTQRVPTLFEIMILQSKKHP